MRQNVEEYTKEQESVNYRIRRFIHTIVYLFNTLSGYRIWKRGEEPEVWE